MKIVNIFEVPKEPFRKVQVKKSLTTLKQTFQPLKTQTELPQLLVHFHHQSLSITQLAEISSKPVVKILKLIP